MLFLEEFFFIKFPSGRVPSKSSLKLFMARDKASFVLSSEDLISVNILTFLLLLLKENVFLS